LCIRSKDDIRSAKLAYSNAEFRCDAFFVHRPTYVEQAETASRLANPRNVMGILVRRKRPTETGWAG
jgi:hypothetical protein